MTEARAHYERDLSLSRIGRIQIVVVLTFNFSKGTVTEIPFEAVVANFYWKTHCLILQRGN